MSTTSVRSGRKRAALTGATLLGVTALITAATFTDNAWLSLNGGSGWGGAGQTFAIEASAGNESTLADVQTWGDYGTAESAGIVLLEERSIVLNPDDPASTAVVNLPVRNATAQLRADVDLGLVASTDGQTAEQQAKNEAYLSAMQFEVAVDGEVAGTYRYDQIDSATPFNVGVLEQADAADDGAVVTLTVSLVTPDGVAVDDFNGGGVELLAHFAGSSVS